jgi:hypothetical protein
VLAGKWRIGAELVLALGLVVPRAGEALFRRDVTEWDGIEAFAKTWRARDAGHAASVVVVPAHMNGVLELYLTGQTARGDRFEHAGTTFTGGDGSSPGGADVAVVFGERVTEIPGCKKETSGTRFEVFDCRPTPAR